MLGIRFHRAAPTTHVLEFRNGRLVREGAGLSFAYLPAFSTVVDVPVGSVDLPFVFSETTADFQTVTVQGQLTYRVSDPRKLASLMDFSVGADGRHASDDPEKLHERLVGVVQELTQEVVRHTSLRGALTACGEITSAVLAGLKSAPSVTMCGIEILGLAVTGVTPTPEMARALEAEMREELQRNADRAIYDRRKAAVEEERKIKESELNTEIAVEEKRRTIRETQMAAEIAVEERRAALVEKKTENDRKEADTRAYGLEATLKPVRDVDWRILMAVTPGTVDPRLMIALAFREMAENAGKIGELNITPDLLGQLLKAPAGEGRSRNAHA